MIEKLAIIDFQNHRRLTVRFGPFVTTLVGPSSIGKTAIVRCLKWVCTNKPSGTRFIGRYGQAPFAAGKLFVDGRTVLRKRGKTNLYALDGNRYRAFKADVPKAVADLLNVGDVNFQNQLDTAYWFALPASAVSKELNAIINLGEIDAALGNAAKLTRRANAAVAVSEQRLADARRQRDDLRWAVDMDTDLRGIERLSERHVDLRLKALGLSEMLSEYQTSATTVQSGSRAVFYAANVCQRAAEWRKISRKVLDLGKLLSDLNLQLELANSPTPDPGPLAVARDNYDRCRLRVRGLSTLLFGITNLDYELCQTKRDIERAEKELPKATGKICPMCKQPIRSPLASTSATSTCQSTFHGAVVKRRTNG